MSCLIEDQFRTEIGTSKSMLKPLQAETGLFQLQLLLTHGAFEKLRCLMRRPHAKAV